MTRVPTVLFDRKARRLLVGDVEIPWGAIGEDVSMTRDSDGRNSITLTIHAQEITTVDPDGATWVSRSLPKPTLTMTREESQ